MAQIYKKETPEKPKPKGGAILFLLAAVCAAAGVILLAQMFAVAVFCFCVAAVLLIIGASYGSFSFDQRNIELSGQLGEEATAGFIAKFPDSYRGFQNLHVTWEGKTSELDMVVVGPTGVFVIETKNHNGLIQGNLEDHDWVQFKTGRAGGQYSKTFYSPVKQVGTHVYRLAHYLRSNGQNVHVDAMVFFTNPDATVQVYGTPGKIPVYAGQPGANLIAQQILSAKPALSPQTVDNICRRLQKCL